MIRITTAVIVVTGFVVGTAHAAAAQTQGHLDRGASVYAAQKCGMCHAIAGKGNGKGPLDTVGSTLTPDEIREWVVNPAAMTKKAKAERKPAMRAYPQLSKDDLDSLVTYLVSLKK